MATVPGQLIWEMVKKNNCFLVKEFGRGNAGVQFSKEPNNLFNLNSFKYSGKSLHFLSFFQSLCMYNKMTTMMIHRFGEPQDGDDSARWQRSVGGIGYHEDEEAEQAGGSASQVGHEEGVSSYGQGCYQSGILTVLYLNL